MTKRIIKFNGCGCGAKDCPYEYEEELLIDSLENSDMGLYSITIVDLKMSFTTHYYELIDDIAKSLIRLTLKYEERRDNDNRLV